MIEPRKAIQTMKPYDPPLEGRREFMRLDFNENSRGCSPKVLEALKQVDVHEIAAYPEYQTFRQRLARFIGLPVENILPTNASDEGILTVFQTYLDPRDELVLPVPTFAMFRFYAEILDLDIKEVLYNEDLSFPDENVFQAISETTKGVVLVNPNNPTGTPIQRTAILKVLDLMQDRLVLLDEAYVEFTRETAINLINDHPNLVILRTFSKAFGMAGARLGIIISCQENIRNLEKTHSPYSISTLTTKIAIAALDDVDPVERYTKEVLEGRERLVNSLKKMGIETFPSSANFILAKFNEKCKFIEKALKARGILVRDRSAYPRLKGCLRITVGTLEQTEILTSALQEIMKKNG
jgi:histidinol-phosphate aminotransferase